MMIENSSLVADLEENRLQVVFFENKQWRPKKAQSPSRAIPKHPFIGRKQRRYRMLPAQPLQYPRPAQASHLGPPRRVGDQLRHPFGEIHRVIGPRVKRCLPRSGTLRRRLGQDRTLRVVPCFGKMAPTHRSAVRVIWAKAQLPFARTRPDTLLHQSRLRAHPMLDRNTVNLPYPSLAIDPFCEIARSSVQRRSRSADDTPRPQPVRDLRPTLSEDPPPMPLPGPFLSPPPLTPHPHPALA